MAAFVQRGRRDLGFYVSTLRDLATGGALLENTLDARIVAEDPEERH